MRNALNVAADSVIRFINRIPLPVFIFLLVTGNFLSFVPTGNEENALLLSRLTIHPDWLTPSLYTDEWIGHRFFYQYTAGFLLEFLSFEQVAFTGRLLVFALMAIPFGQVVRLFKLTNIELFFILQILFLPYQSFFAGEWILGGFESKAFAYPLVLLALYALLKNRLYPAIILCAISAYLHVLIAGWFMIVFFLFLLITKKSIKKIFFAGIVAGAILFPLFFFLSGNLFNNPVKETFAVSPDWINVYFRNPHHLGLTSGFQYFFVNHLKGVLLALAFLTLSVIFHFKNIFKDTEHKQVNLLIIIIFSLQMICLVAGLFDKDGAFLKFYPYRTGSVGMLLSLLLLGSVVFPILRESWFKKYLTFLLLLVSFLFYSTAVIENSGRSYLYAFKKNTAVNQLSEFAKNNIAEDKVFLQVGFEELTFVRKSGRNVLVYYKFFPYTYNKIFEWYEKMQMKTQAESDLNDFLSKPQSFQVDYIISMKKMQHHKLKEVYWNEQYYVYQIG